MKPGWVRTVGGRADGHEGSKFGIWEHVSGWRVVHCGHPTALWPYYGSPPENGPMLLAPNGRGFKHLLDAQLAVETKVETSRAAVTP